MDMGNVMLLEYLPIVARAFKGGWATFNNDSLYIYSLFVPGVSLPTSINREGFPLANCPAGPSLVRYPSGKINKAP